MTDFATARNQSCALSEMLAKINCKVDSFHVYKILLQRWEAVRAAFLGMIVILNEVEIWEQIYLSQRIIASELLRW